VIFTGVAGSINPDLQIGDVVVGRDALHHDMDATALGLERGAIPFSDFRIIPCDPGLVRIASDLTPPRGSCRVGRVLTGDQFIVSPATRRKLREEFGGDCVEMEGASVALVCAVNDVGCVLIRTISDHADGTVDFSRAIAVAAENAYHYVRGILAAI
jgi:adenosylhomocysteine nucleosidase